MEPWYSFSAQATMEWPPWLEALCLWGILIFVFHSCINDMDPIMLQRKWRIMDTVPLAQGSYWVTGSDILDFTDLSNSGGSAAKMYFQQIDGKNFIKFNDNNSYFEVLKLTDEKLEIGLYIQNPETKEENMITVIKCESLDK